MKTILGLIIALSFFSSCENQVPEKNNNISELISTDTAKLSKYIYINKFKPLKAKFKYIYFDNSASEQRMSVPGPSDGRIEGILYFDDATFDSILTVYDKQEWTMYDIQKQYFNFEWLDKDVKEELEKTELEKAYMPDYFFTRSELGHCLLMDKKILFFKYSN